MKTTNENLTTASTVEDGKTIAIVAYLTVIGLVAALVMNNDRKNTFSGFHIRQSLGLMLTALATSLVSWVPFIGWIFGLIMFVILVVIWIIGLMNAVNGKEKTLPVLGEKYAEWFKGV